MKKTKLLIPALSIIGSLSLTAPIITSCNKNTSHIVEPTAEQKTKQASHDDKCATYSFEFTEEVKKTDLTIKIKTQNNAKPQLVISDYNCLGKNCDILVKLEGDVKETTTIKFDFEIECSKGWTTKISDCSFTYEVIHVTKVALNKTTLQIEKDDTYQLQETVTPIDADDKTVTWKSSKPAVATVDTTGKVTALSEGTATITVITNDGSKTAQCAVTVVDSSGFIVTSPTHNIDISSATTVQFDAQEEHVSVTGCTWSVTPSNAGTISNTGLLTLSSTAISNGGNATVTATKDGKTASFDISLATFGKLDATQLLLGKAVAASTTVSGCVVIPSKYYDAANSKWAKITSIPANAFSSATGLTGILCVSTSPWLYNHDANHIYAWNPNPTDSYNLGFLNNVSKDLTMTEAYSIAIVTSPSPAAVISAPAQQYTFADGKLVIPTKCYYGYTAYDVQGIWHNAFKGNTTIKTVDIKSEIGFELYNSCFEGCTSLTTFNITNATDTVWIDAYAFNGCTSLTDLYIPANIEKIAPTAFDNTNLDNTKIDSENVTDKPNTEACYPLFLNKTKMYIKEDIAVHNDIQGYIDLRYNLTSTTQGYKVYTRK